MSDRKKCLDALDYFYNCEDVNNFTTDRRYYTKILLNKISKIYNVDHVFKF